MNPVRSKDPGLRGSWPALLRSAETARKRAKLTGAPFYVMRNGKITNLNPRPRHRNATAKAR